ncbi:MAG: NUDIX domain-containing protein [Cyanobacteria bacterium CRU_2_1]|nr:NUDIX domain-containing protein [Cyanobacteria bacterium RU_5_0]NJR58050.1 NUDIX domain-containing protein [Cyanobacteria bacterium CRU_2_1]
MSNQIKQDQAFGIVPILRHKDGDRFLLIQHLAGHWGFPKGHAETGESAVVAACRELEEETGIRGYQLLEQVSFSEHYRFIKDDKTIEKTVTYFLAVVQSKEVVCQAIEIKDYVWATFDVAIGRITFDQARQVLIQVNQYLTSELRTEA